MILFFDLDGPLLDVSHRYVALHHELLGEHGRAGMEAVRYWAYKRATRPEEEILAELGAEDIAAVYMPRRFALIESPAFLRYDRCWPWTSSCLAHLARHARLVMVTARSDRAALLHQLEEFDLYRHFHEILSQGGGIRVDLRKAMLIDEYLQRHQVLRQGHWMIGDTEADVLAGKLVGLQTAAVLSGIRDEAHLTKARPDFLLPDIRDLPPVLNLPPLLSGKSEPEVASS
jgi:phosphoglycolate phosphatase